MIPITQADLNTAATMIQVVKAARDSIDAARAVAGKSYTPEEMAIWKDGGRAVADFIENVARMTIAASRMGEGN